MDSSKYTNLRWVRSKLYLEEIDELFLTENGPKITYFLFLQPFHSSWSCSGLLTRSSSFPLHIFHLHFSSLLISKLCSYQKFHFLWSEKLRDEAPADPYTRARLHPQAKADPREEGVGGLSSALRPHPPEKIEEERKEERN